MNKLDREARANIIHLLCEGNSIRATCRLTGVSKKAVTKLMVDAGQASVWYQDRVFQNLECKRIQVDEIWGFVGSKAANTDPEKKKTGEAGDCWLWVATDADTKLVPAWHVGSRGKDDAIIFMDTLAVRLAGRIQLTSDSHVAYADAVEETFGTDVDYGQLVKIYGKVPESLAGRYSPAACLGARKLRVQGNPDPKHISTSYSERNNLNVRMHSRRMTRLTNAFSKKLVNHAHAMALHFLYYNFVRIHQTLKMTPAMAAKVTSRLWEIGDIVDVVEAWEAAQ